MLVTVLYCKINCNVTKSSFDYKGSITIDKDVIRELGLTIHELVHVNNNNGHRDQTYIIEGGKGAIETNGALAANHKEGDKIHINCYRQMTLEESEKHEPKEITL